MNKLVCIILMISIVFLYLFNINNNLITFAKTSVDDVIVFNDKSGEELISISEDNLQKFLDKLFLQNYNEFRIEDRLIIEGYSSKIKNYITIDNKKINIQISIFDGVCLIGSPIIKNSF